MFLLFYFLIFSLSYSSSKIDEISIKGNKEVPNFLILNHIDFKEKEDFEIKKLTSSYANLLNLGYFDNVHIKPVVESGRLILDLEVEEKGDIYNILKNKGIYTNSEILSNKVPPLIIKLNIEGNYSVDNEDILKNVDIQVGNYYSKDRLELVKNSIERMGLFSKVSYSMFNTDDGVEITIIVEENKYVGSDILFRGNSLITDEELLEVVKTEKDNILNVRVLFADVSRIEKIYSDKDYTGITINPLFEGDSLIFDIKEPLVGKILFKRKNYLHDSEKLNTYDYVLRRHVNLEEGKPLKKSDLNKSVRDLKRLGFFKSIAPNVAPGEGNKKNIEFIVEEEFGIKFSMGLNGTFGGDLKANFNFENKNFLGREFDVAVSFDYDINNKWKGRVYFFDPWIYGTNRISYGIDLYRTNQDSKKDDMYFNNTIVSGASLNLGFPLYGNELRLSLKEDIKIIEQYDEMSSSFTNHLWDLYVENTVTGSISLNLLDNYVDPTNGYYFKLSLGWETHFPFSGIEYRNFKNKPDVLITNISNKLYLPFLAEMNTIAIRLDLAYSKFISDHNINYGGYNLGGHTTIRGYDTETMKGNIYILFNLENRLSLYDKEIKLESFVFFDVGFSIFESDMNSLHDLIEKNKKSIGIGLRIKKFLLPISFNLSFPIDQEDSFLKPEFNFGYTF